MQQPTREHLLQRCPHPPHHGPVLLPGAPTRSGLVGSWRGGAGQGPPEQGPTGQGPTRQGRPAHGRCSPLGSCPNPITLLPCSPALATQAASAGQGVLPLPAPRSLCPGLGGARGVRCVPRQTPLWQWPRLGPTRHSGRDTLWRCSCYCKGNTRAPGLHGG